VIGAVRSRTGTSVALTPDMDKPMFEDGPGLPGPDYVALVIEWDELANALEGEREPEPEIMNERETVTEIPSERRPALAMRITDHPLRALAAAIGALGLLVFSVWGIHRLRAA